MATKDRNFVERVMKQVKKKAVEDADKPRVEYIHKQLKKVEKRISKMHKLLSSSKK